MFGDFSLYPVTAESCTPHSRSGEEWGAELVRAGDSHALLCPGQWKYCEWTHQVGAASVADSHTPVSGVQV